MLSRRVSNTLGTSFCIDAPNEAIDKHGAQEIFNTDQSSQFTSEEFAGVLQQHDIRISMDGKGRGVDNVFVERLWRRVKYEAVYLKAYGGIRVPAPHWTDTLPPTTANDGTNHLTDRRLLSGRCQAGGLTRGSTYRAVQFKGTISNDRAITGGGL